MSISFTPSQMVLITGCVSILYGKHASDQTIHWSFQMLPEEHQMLVTLVVRAYYRFQREFACYERYSSSNAGEGQTHRSNLPEVRKYHRLLIAAARDLDSYLVRMKG